MSDANELPVSAQDQVLASIDQLLAENENALTVPLTKINQALNAVIESNGKAVSKFTTKIVRAMDRQIVANDDRLNAVQTTILQGIDSWLSDQEYLLQQLASKGGLTELGEPLAAALTKESTEGRQLTYEGTLVLKVAEAVPWLERIAIALERIADYFDESPSIAAPAGPGDPAALVEEDKRIPVLTPPVAEW
jgi:hypothetical protein